MLIVLIALVALVAGIVLILLDDGDLEAKFGIGVALTCLGVIVGVAASIAAISVQVREDVAYEKTLARKQAIEYSIEHREENLIGNELLFADVVAFNNDIREEKWKAESPWVNWFANDKIADIDYIDYTEHD
jgi:hypothetical protein